MNVKSHPEKQYCEHLMLITSWRNEENDLIGNSPSYQEHLLLLKDKIDKKMGQYAIFSEDIDEIEEQLHNTDDPDYPFHDWRELDNLRYISLSKGIYGIAL